MNNFKKLQHATRAIKSPENKRNDAAKIINEQFHIKI